MEQISKSGAYHLNLPRGVPTGTLFRDGVRDKFGLSRTGGAIRVLGGALLDPLWEGSTPRGVPLNAFVADRIEIADFEGLECSGRYGHVLIGVHIKCHIEENGLLRRMHRHPVARGPRLADL